MGWCWASLMFAARNPQKTCFSLVENVLLVSDFNQNRFDRFTFEGFNSQQWLEEMLRHNV